MAAAVDPREELTAVHATDIQAPGENHSPAPGVVAATGAFDLFLAASLVQTLPSIVKKKDRGEHESFHAMQAALCLRADKWNAGVCMKLSLTLMWLAQAVRRAPPCTRSV